MEVLQNIILVQSQVGQVVFSDVVQQIPDLGDCSLLCPSQVLSDGVTVEPRDPREVEEQGMETSFLHPGRTETVGAVRERVPVGVRLEGTTTEKNQSYF